MNSNELKSTFILVLLSAMSTNKIDSLGRVSSRVCQLSLLSCGGAIWSTHGQVSLLEHHQAVLPHFQWWLHASGGGLSGCRRPRFPLPRPACPWPRSSTPSSIGTRDSTAGPTRSPSATRNSSCSISHRIGKMTGAGRRLTHKRRLRTTSGSGRRSWHGLHLSTTLS